MNISPPNPLFTQVEIPNSFHCRSTALGNWNKRTKSQDQRIRELKKELSHHQEEHFRESLQIWSNV
jgi:hypothetical protein